MFIESFPRTLSVKVYLWDQIKEWGGMVFFIYSWVGIVYPVFNYSRACMLLCTGTYWPGSHVIHKLTVYAKKHRKGLGNHARLSLGYIQTYFHILL